MLHILIFPFMRAISSRELGFGKYILKEQVILGDIRPSQCLGIVIICKTRSGKWQELSPGVVLRYQREGKKIRVYTCHYQLPMNHVKI